MEYDEIRFSFKADAGRWKDDLMMRIIRALQNVDVEIFEADMTYVKNEKEKQDGLAEG